MLPIIPILPILPMKRACWQKLYLKLLVGAKLLKSKYSSLNDKELP
jgi:hypothetical protein